MRRPAAPSHRLLYGKQDKNAKREIFIGKRRERERVMDGKERMNGDENNAFQIKYNVKYK